MIYQRNFQSILYHHPKPTLYKMKIYILLMRTGDLHTVNEDECYSQNQDFTQHLIKTGEMGLIIIQKF